MRVKTVVLTAFGLLLSTAVAAPAAGLDLEDIPLDDETEAEFDRIVAREPCHPSGLHAIGASGAGANNFHSFGLLSTTMAGILAAVPHSTNITLPYPKAAAAYGAPDPLPAITKGTHNMRRYLKKFFDRCPNTPIALVGYSAGAIMTTNNICGGMGVGQLPEKYRHRVISATVYGDETFVPNEPFDRGTCTDGYGTHPRDPTTCLYFRHKLRSWCDAPDPDCCGGDDTEAHFEYPGEYDGDVAAFVLHKFNAFHGK